MARQGHAFATADETRVVLFNEDGSLRDVPEDGRTLGEIAVRGNIVMKEVSLPTFQFDIRICRLIWPSTTVIHKRPQRPLLVAILQLVT